MFTIGICDDELWCRNELVNLCNEFFGDNIQIYQFSDGVSFLESLSRVDYSIVFFDIEMKEIKGTDVKNIMERNGVENHIIFVSSYPQYALEAFGRNVWGFVEKPINKNHLFYLLNKILRYDLYNENVTFYDVEGKLYIIKSNKIKRIHSEHVYSKVTLENGEEILVRRSLNEWKNELNQVIFFRIGKSNIINMRYVENINDMVYLEGGIAIKIGRGKIKEVKTAYLKYISKMT